MSGRDTGVEASGVQAAMVMAAGLGQRMRPITDTRPKPLVEVGGRTLLDHALDRLAEAGIARVVVNVHHLADQVEAHLAGRHGSEIVVSDERAGLLETGGGVRKALPHLGQAFAVMNSDSLWIDGPSPNLARLLATWDPAAMDVLLLLASATDSMGYDGEGDFTMDPNGRLARRGEREMAPFVYAGVGIMSAALFDGSRPLPDGAFSLNVVFDRAIEAGRLYGMRLEGAWLHVGTPGAIRQAEERLTAGV